MSFYNCLNRARQGFANVVNWVSDFLLHFVANGARDHLATKSMKLTVEDKRKGIEAIVYAAGRMPGISHSNVSKVLFFAEIEHLRLYRGSMFGAQYLENGSGRLSATDVVDQLVATDSLARSNATLEADIRFNRLTYKAAREPSFELLRPADTDCLDKALDLVRCTHFSEWGFTRERDEISFGHSRVLEVV